MTTIDTANLPNLRVSLDPWIQPTQERLEELRAMATEFPAVEFTLDDLGQVGYRTWAKSLGGEYMFAAGLGPAVTREEVTATLKLLTAWEAEENARWLARQR